MGGIRGLDYKAQRLIAARGIRGVAQGLMVVDFTLYLRALSWSAVSIGALFAAAMVVSIVLTLVLGPLSDRVGRKRFLLGYEATQLAAAVIAVSTSQPQWLALAAIATGYGRGATGAMGPFSPIEQSWLAAGLTSPEIAHAFRLNMAAGFLAMGAGALLAGLPGWLSPWLQGAVAYRAIFAVAGLTAVLCFALLRTVPELPVAPAAAQDMPAQRHVERRRLTGLIGVNLLNGLGISMVGPFLAYWFQLRFGAGPGAIGPVMSAGFVLAGLSTLATSRLIDRLGLVDAVVVMRFFGLVFLLLLPFSTSFAIAATLHILRSTLSRATAGARQALTVQLVSPERRGLAVSLGTVSSQIPRALGPLLGGLLFDADLLAAPFLVAGLFQTAYLTLYRRLFRRLPFAGPL
ncbi:MAG TPA: MFS transporter [Stellaceae bacterium]|nr:MFS transporter [Stellaceae bacterium]